MILIPFKIRKTFYGHKFDTTEYKNVEEWNYDSTFTEAQFTLPECVEVSETLLQSIHLPFHLRSQLILTFIRVLAHIFRVLKPEEKMLVFMRFRKKYIYIIYIFQKFTQNETSLCSFKHVWLVLPKSKKKRKSYRFGTLLGELFLKCAGTSAPVLSWKPPSGSSSFPVVACPPLFSGTLDLTPYGSDEKRHTF